MVVKFGYGTVGITCGGTIYDDGVARIALKSIDALPVGAEFKHGCKTFGELEPDVMLTFGNKESIDILIENLEAIKKLF